MAKYNKEQINPFTKKWEVTGVAELTKNDAKVLNTTTKHSGVKYVLAKKAVREKEKEEVKEVKENPSISKNQK